MNILITGYNGFIGSNIIRNLSGHHYTGIDLVHGNSVNSHLNWSELDRVNNVDCIIHLAGKVHDTGNTIDEKQYYEVNVGLTKQIFNVFLKSDAKKFIFFSSVKAVADTVPGLILTEETTPDPLTPYGKSKLQAEQFILEQDIPDEKKVYILRPCMVHGSGNKGNLNLLYGFAKKGFPWPLGAFSNKRSFVSIDNLLFIINQLLEREIEPGVYQVADDETLSTNELLNLISGSLGKKSRIWSIPPGVIRTMAGIGDLLRLPLNTGRLKKLTESYIVSNQKLKNALNISKMPVTASDGITMTINSFKQESTNN